MKPVDLKELGVTVLRVKALLDQSDRTVGNWSDDPSGYHARHRAEMAKVVAVLEKKFGAAVNDRWDGASVRILGIRSSSTSGIAGALRNWLNAAARRIEQETGR